LKPSFSSIQTLKRKNVFLASGVDFRGDICIEADVEIWHNCVIGFEPDSKVGRYRLVDERNNSPLITALGRGTCLYPFSIIHQGAKLGNNVSVSEFSRIGSNTTIGNNATIEYGAKIYDRVKVGNEAVLAGFCCNDSTVGNHATMLGHLVHKYPKRMSASQWNTTDERPAAPTIEDNVVIGYNAIIIGGVTIGHDSYVAAGAIVAKSVPANTRLIMKSPTERQELSKGDS
jgi:acetyltransferase-like isoleucine patch superfamily enzyme